MDTQRYYESLETFYKYQLWIFRILGLWRLPDNVTPRYRILHTIYFYYIFLFWVLSFNVCCIIQLIGNITDINEIIKVFFIFATCLGMLSKFSTIKLKNQLCYELIEIIKEPMFRPANRREIKIFKKSRSLCRTVRNYYCTLASCSFQAMFLFQYFVDKTELPLSVYNPIKIDKNWHYLIMYFYQYISVAVACYTNVAFDTLSSSLLMHVKNQLDILCDRLEYLDADLGSEQNNLIDDNKMTFKLKNCIKYYDEIVKVIRMVENLVSLPISTQIACSVLVLVANFYAMTFLTSPGDYVSVVKIAIYQMCMLSQIYILCYFSNEVTVKSKEISYYLYCSDWMKWNKENRRLALLMMNRFDLPICIRSINPTYTFNLEAFTSIVNCSYSYFALLKNANS